MLAIIARASDRRRGACTRRNVGTVDAMVVGLILDTLSSLSYDTLRFDRRGVVYSERVF